MVYIESHQQLGAHPKTKKAARLLGLSRPAVVGHLQYLWWWCMDFAKDGDLTRYSSDVIADGALWDGDPDSFITALVDCSVEKEGYGFLERTTNGSLFVHDWHQYGGKLVGKKESDAERKRRTRSETGESPLVNPTMSIGRPLDVRAPSETEARTAQVDNISIAEHSEAKTTTTEQSREERSVEERNTSAGGSPCPDSVVVALSLRDLGVSEGVAAELVRSKGCEYVQKQIEWWPYRLKEKQASGKPVRDPGAFLAKAIQDGYAVPESYSQAKKAQDQQIRRSARAQERSEQNEAEKRVSELSQEAIEATLTAMPPPQQEEVAAEATREFVRLYPLHAKRHAALLPDSPGLLPAGPRVLWQGIRDTLVAQITAPPQQLSPSGVKPKTAKEEMPTENQAPEIKEADP